MGDIQNRLAQLQNNLKFANMPNAEGIAKDAAEEIERLSAENERLTKIVNEVEIVAFADQEDATAESLLAWMRSLFRKDESGNPDLVCEAHGQSYPCSYCETLKAALTGESEKQPLPELPLDGRLPR